jgi:hypothetical protein
MPIPMQPAALANYLNTNSLFATPIIEAQASVLTLTQQEEPQSPPLPYTRLQGLEDTLVPPTPATDPCTHLLPLTPAIQLP